MASGAGIDAAAASSAGVIQRGTGRHELPWLQDPQIMEGDLRIIHWFYSILVYWQ